MWMRKAEERGRGVSYEKSITPVAALKLEAMNQGMWTGCCKMERARKQILL